MRVKHEQYGIGYAENPFKDNGLTLIKVKFAFKEMVFSYPQAFNNKTLIKIDDAQPTYTFTQVPQNFKSELLSVVSEYIADFNKQNNNPTVNQYIVKNSIPIVWFGDIEKYIKSEKKLLTIGLNPSNQEFKENRFNIIDISNPDNETAEKLSKTLNQYFEENPYKFWFNKYERLINVFDCTYGGNIAKKHNAKYQAVHIDLCTAIATNPTWRRLDKTQKEQFKNKPLFFRLFNLLDPDLILISINKDDLEDHFPLTEWKKENYYKFRGNNSITIFKNNNKFLISGTNMQGMPFQGINEEESKKVLLDFKEKIYG